MVPMPRIRNRTIRLIVFRVFAAFNLLFAIQGFWALGQASFVAISTMPGHAPARYVPHFFLVFSACNIAFLFGLMVSASLLWEMRHRAVRRSSYLFVGMIVYIFLKDMAGALVSPWGASATLAGLAGGNAGISWMERSGYPLIALLVLNAVKYLTRRSSQHAVSPPRTR
jgi:hypothetical protein